MQAPNGQNLSPMAGAQGGQAAGAGLDGGVGQTSNSQSTTPGGQYFRHVVLPGVDYFELRISPW